MPTKEYGHRNRLPKNKLRKKASDAQGVLFPEFKNKNLINFQDKTSWYHLGNFPTSLKNKLKVLISVSKKFECQNWEEMRRLYEESEAKRERNEQVEELTPEHFKAQPDCLDMVKLSKVVFGKNFSLLFLSNGNFQAIFEDQLEIFFCRDSESVSITKDEDFNINYSINNFVLIDNENLWKRITYVNRVLKTIQGNQFILDTKHSGVKLTSVSNIVN